ncbi:MAG: hypothetical protein P8H03_11745 [Emcibacteraceae bacterium]|nr:hypothetical protein [Emcibacteraceae bacterium]MDG1858212.1 hypothetical protein [Emcibacteraceae bacterium]
MKKTIIMAIGCLAIGSSAMAYETIAQKAANKEFAKYNQTGTFEKCIKYNMIKKNVVIDDTKIIFKMKNNNIVMNTLNSQCHSLAFERKFNFGVSNNRICEKDLIHTRRDTCLLSKFETLEEKS